MCGIAGYIGNSLIESSAIKGTLELMVNRGPDNQSHASINDSNLRIEFLHSRLSIIDLDKRSNQPFQKGNCTLIFNGEIYNYKEVRQDLISRGHSFKTDSDTEVVITSYIEFGEDCVKEFEGMWALALFDKSNHKLFLSRDRFGEKPLYLFENNNGIYFASETSFIRKLSEQNFSKNLTQIKRLLVNGHKALYKNQDTFYENISELEFASNLTIDLNLSKKKYKYWQPSFTPFNSEDNPIGTTIEEVRSKLIESMRLRLRSDVPLAFCLSGGIDSASLVSIASKCFNANVTTFSIIDPDERYNELDNIQATIEDTGCKNYQITLSNTNDYLDRLKQLIDYHDAPILTISYLVHSLLSEEMSNRGYKISISGTGADELFTGYYDHFILHLFEMRSSANFNEYKNDWEKHVQHLVRHPAFKQHNFYFNNPKERGHIYLNNETFSTFLTSSFKEEFIETSYTDSLLRNRMLNELFHEVVPIILHEDDLNSMKYSVENRSPFLDKSLFEFAYSIPNDYLIKDGYSKYLLREAMKGILNDKVRLTREKRGFNASINSIIDFNNPKHLEFLMSESPIFELVSRKKIEELIKDNYYPNSFKKFIFNFINAKLFLDN